MISLESSNACLRQFRLRFRVSVGQGHFWPYASDRSNLLQMDELRVRLLSAVLVLSSLVMLTLVATAGSGVAARGPRKRHKAREAPRNRSLQKLLLPNHQPRRLHRRRRRLRLRLLLLHRRRRHPPWLCFAAQLETARTSSAAPRRLRRPQKSGRPCARPLAIQQSAERARRERSGRVKS